MSTSSSLPAYARVTQALREIDAPLDAAELHGFLCGLLCTVPQLDEKQWLEKALPGEPDSILPTAREVFDELWAATRQALRDGDFSFRLLLPEEDVELPDRVEALGHWSQGFLLGLNEGGLKDLTSLSGDLPEIAADLVEIAGAEGFELVDEEEDETAYTELVEYVRVGVQLFCEELHTPSGESGPAGAPPGTSLH